MNKQLENGLKDIYESLPMDVQTTLDTMAYQISLKEDIEIFDVKSRMVSNVDKLSQEEAEYLVGNLAILIDKSVNQSIIIDDKNTNKDFISFLIKLYY